MKYELPRGYLSASAIGTLMNCPRQYKYRYIDGLIIPPTAALVTGSVMHKVFEEYYHDAMVSPVRFTVDQAVEMACDTASDYIVQNEIKLTDSEINTMFDDVRPLTRTYIENVAQHIKPLGTEEEVRVTLTCGVDILAYLDLRHEIQYTDEQVKTAAENGEVLEKVGLCDYKITGKKWTPDRLKNSLQFNLYTYITDIHDVQIHNLVKVPYKPVASRRQVEPGVQDYASNLRVLNHTFNGEDNAHIESLVESAARLITSGIFMPAPMDSWCCTPDWCGYWSLCRGRGRTTYHAVS